MTTIHHGDCIETMNAMPPESVDAIVTDPPYGLGFMGKKWDGLPPSLEWAEACYRVLKPGGHIAAATEGLWDYRRLLDAGVANEVARNVLPASVYTQMWVTGTLRSWLHFLDQRLDEHAQWEVRQVAEQVAEIIRHIFPVAYRAWEEKRAV